MRAFATRLRALLRRHGKDFWAEWLEQAVSTERLLRAFGGMSSLNDVYLHPSNGHAIDLDDVAHVNARLHALLGSIYALARELRRGEALAARDPDE